MTTCETSDTLRSHPRPGSNSVGATLHEGGMAIFQQNTRDEVRFMQGDGQVAGALAAEPGMKQQNYLLTLSAAASPARTYQWPVSVRALTEPEAASGLSSIESCPNCGQPFASSKMFPGFYPVTEEQTLRSSSGVWSNSGMLSAGQYWTRNTSESRNAAAVCTLSAVLQDQVSSKYFLSAKAATGILRRAERRGKTLPAQLAAALTALAGEPKTTPT